MKTDIKVLIIDDEPDILEIISSIIEAEMDCEILQASSGNSAVKLLQEHLDISIILSDYTMPDGNGATVYNYNLSNKNLPFIFISGGYLEDYKDVKNFFSSNEANAYIHKPIDIDSLVNCINIARNYKKEEALIPGVRYSALSSSLLSKYNVDKYDLYIKINDVKYLKIKNSKEEFKSLDSKYQSSDYDGLYLEHCDFKDFISSIINSVQLKLAKKNTEVQTVELCGQSLEIMHEALASLGMNKEQMLLVNTTVESTLDLLKSSRVMSERISIFLKASGYFISHSLTSAHIVYLIANKIGMAQESIINKLVSAALLHDITLANSKLCQIMDLESDEFSKLSRKEQALVKEHSLACSTLLANDELIDQDVLTIIKEHHELPNGGGFPRGLTHRNLSGLSMIYIAALRFADHIYQNGYGANSLMKFLEILKQSGFDTGHGKRIFEGVSEVIASAAQQEGRA